MRLKPHAIDVRVSVDPIHYFLNDRHDTRSSYYLEDAATEFQVQGLELDWICVTRDADLRCIGPAVGNTTPSEATSGSTSISRNGNSTC